MTRITTRYVVRNARGEELVVPTLGDLHKLYVHGFLGEDDLVRSERSDRWVPAGKMDALAGVREVRGERPARVLLVAAALAAVVGALLWLARLAGL